MCRTNRRCGARYSGAENHAVSDGPDAASGRASDADVRRHQRRPAANDELGGGSAARRRRCRGRRRLARGRARQNAPDQCVHEYSQHRLAPAAQQRQLLLRRSQRGRNGDPVAAGSYSRYLKRNESSHRLTAPPSIQLFSPSVHFPVPIHVAIAPIGPRIGIRFCCPAAQVKTKNKQTRKTVTMTLKENNSWIGYQSPSLLRIRTEISIPALPGSSGHQPGNPDQNLDVLCVVVFDFHLTAASGTQIATPTHPHTHIHTSAYTHTHTHTHTEVAIESSQRVTRCIQNDIGCITCDSGVEEHSMSVTWFLCSHCTNHPHTMHILTCHVTRRQDQGVQSKPAVGASQR